MSSNSIHPIRFCHIQCNQCSSCFIIFHIHGVNAVCDCLYGFVGNCATDGNSIRPCARQLFYGVFCRRSGAHIMHVQRFVACRASFPSCHRFTRKILRRVQFGICVLLRGVFALQERNRIFYGIRSGKFIPGRKVTSVLIFVGYGVRNTLPYCIQRQVFRFVRRVRYGCTRAVRRRVPADKIIARAGRFGKCQHIYGRVSRFVCFCIRSAAQFIRNCVYARPPCVYRKRTRVFGSAGNICAVGKIFAGVPTGKIIPRAHCVRKSNGIFHRVGCFVGFGIRTAVQFIGNRVWRWLPLGVHRKRLCFSFGAGNVCAVRKIFARVPARKVIARADCVRKRHGYGNGIQFFVAFCICSAIQHIGNVMHPFAEYAFPPLRIQRNGGFVCCDYVFYALPVSKKRSRAVFFRAPPQKTVAIAGKRAVWQRLFHVISAQNRFHAARAFVRVKGDRICVRRPVRIKRHVATHGIRTRRYSLRANVPARKIVAICL